MVSCDLYTPSTELAFEEAGTNIIIDGNTISSSGGGEVTQSELFAKQDKLNTSSNISTGTISSGSITGRDLGVLNFQTIEGTLIRGSTLIYGTSNNVGNIITSINSTLNNKQAALGSNINITTGTIS